MLPQGLEVLMDICQQGGKDAPLMLPSQRLSLVLWDTGDAEGKMCFIFPIRPRGSRAALGHIGAGDCPRWCMWGLEREERSVIQIPVCWWQGRIHTDQRMPEAG